MVMPHYSIMLRLAALLTMLHTGTTLTFQDMCSRYPQAYRVNELCDILWKRAYTEPASDPLESDVYAVPEEHADSYYSPRNRRGSGYIRFGRSADHLGQRQRRSIEDENNGVPLESSANESAEKRYMRFGKREGADKRYMRFGKREDGEKRYMRFGRDPASDEDRKDEEKRYMRFGRDPQEKRYMRFGREPDKRYMRFGRDPQEEEKRYMRFGRDPEEEKRYMRFGKKSSFSEAVAEGDKGPVQKKEANYKIFGKRSTNKLS